MKYIVAIGGYNSKGKVLGSCELYSLSQNMWLTSVNINMNQPRRAMSSVTLPDGIYVIGGFDGVKYLNSVEKINYQFFNSLFSQYNNNVSSKSFNFISSISQQMCTMAAIGSEDWSYIYVSGGFETDGIDNIQRQCLLIILGMIFKMTSGKSCIR